MDEHIYTSSYKICFKYPHKVAIYGLIQEKNLENKMLSLEYLT